MRSHSKCAPQAFGGNGNGASEDCGGVCTVGHRGLAATVVAEETLRPRAGAVG